MKCETCLGTGYYGDNGPGRKGNKEFQRCECGGQVPSVDKECITHHSEQKVTECERRKCQYWVIDHCSDTEEFYNNGGLCCRYHFNAVRRTTRDYDKERLDRIDAVWQEHKHLDYLLTDPGWLAGNSSLSHIVHDLWQAIRREE